MSTTAATRAGRLVDQLLENKVRYVQSYRDEVNELAEFLDPVQFLPESVLGCAGIVHAGQSPARVQRADIGRISAAQGAVAAPVM